MAPDLFKRWKRGTGSRSSRSNSLNSSRASANAPRTPALRPTSLASLWSSFGQGSQRSSLRSNSLRSNSQRSNSVRSNSVRSNSVRSNSLRSNAPGAAGPNRSRAWSMFRRRPKPSGADAQRLLGKADELVARARMVRNAVADKTSANNDNSSFALMQYQNRTRRAIALLDKAETLRKNVSRQADVLARSGKLVRGPLTRRKDGSLDLPNTFFNLDMQIQAEGAQAKKQYAAAQRRVEQLKRDAFQAQRLADDVRGQLRVQKYKPLSQQDGALTGQIDEDHKRASGIADAAMKQLQRMEATRHWAPGPFKYHSKLNNVSWDAKSAQALNAISTRTQVRAQKMRRTKWVQHRQPNAW